MGSTVVRDVTGERIESNSRPDAAESSTNRLSVIEGGQTTSRAGEWTAEPAPVVEPEPAANGPKVRIDPGFLHFGRYHILGSLGQGGMGQVLLAYDPRLERRIALKILDGSRGPSDERDQSRLQREARSLANVDHPSLVEVFDVGTSNGQIYLAMEFIAGQTLRRWVRDTQPTWDQIADVMVQAGRGLEAAHGVGIIHRDFKPDNVMVDPEGRARVIDFGIALDHGQLGAEEPQPVAAVGTPAPDREDSMSLSSTTRLTTTNSVLGTPAYMPPEQRAGAELDGRADQFAYCVTFLELLGVDGPRDLARRLHDRPTRARSSSHPDWLLELLARGVEQDANLRHGSIAHVCDAIERGLKWHRGRRRRRWVAALVLGVSMTTGIAAHAMAAVADERSLCPSARAQWSDIWDAPRRGQLRDVFVRTRPDSGAETWRRVHSLIDEHVSDWLSLHAKVCRATRIDGDASGADMDLRMRCLDLDRQRFRSLVDELAHANAKLVNDSITAVHKMPSVHLCADANQLRSDSTWTDAEASDPAADELRERLTRAEVWFNTGRWRESAALVDESIPAARERGLSGILAELHFWRGAASDAMGIPASAREHMERSLVAASAARRRELAARASLALVFNRAYVQGDLQHAPELLGAARSRVRAAGDDPDLLAEYWTTQGIVHGISHRLEASESAFRRALGIVEDHFGGQHPRMGFLLGNLAIALTQLGHMDRAMAMERRALATMQAIFGPEHPNVALPHSNIGTSLRGMGRVHEALAHDRQAVRICDAAGTSNSMGCFRYNENLALDLELLGDIERALELTQQDADMQDRSNLRGGFEFPWLSVRRAWLHGLLGEYEPALKLARAGLARTLADPTAPSFVVGDAHMNLAVALRNRGQLAAALDHHRKSVDVIVGDGPLLQHYRAFALKERANTKLAMGRAIEAHRDHVRAFELARQYEGKEGFSTAEYQRDLAASAERIGEVDVAVAHASAAVEAYTAAVGPDSPRLADYWARLASAHRSAGQFESAHEAYDRAVQLHGPRRKDVARRDAWARAAQRLQHRRALSDPPPIVR